jgi:RHS repeat-associated protein
MVMAGISSEAAGGLENKKKYNGIEFDNDLDINTYEAFYRNLDPQIGRWWQIDPQCEPNEDPDEPGLESLSPYNSMGNDPIRYSDPKGDLFGLDNLVGAVVGAVIEVGTQIAVNAISGKRGADLLDLDYGDIAIEAGVGFATSGLVNVANLGKTATKVVAAINTVEKVVESSKVLKVAAAVGKDVLQAAVDVKKDGVKVVGVNKDLKEAAVDLGGSAGGKGLEKAGTGYINKGLAKAAAKAETKAARALSGSANQAAYKSQAAEIKSLAKGNAKAAATAAGVVSGAVAEKEKKQ